MLWINHEYISRPFSPAVDGTGGVFESVIGFSLPRDHTLGRPGLTITRDIEMLGLDGRVFTQRRRVPVGSNWPSNIEGTPDGPPRSAVVGIRRKDGGRLF